MKETIEDICEKLDDLLIHSLSLMEEKIVTTIQLENHLRDGHLELAKARYIQGKESVGMLQIPQETEIKSVFNLETTYPECSDDDNDTRNIPRFTINLKSKKELSTIQDPLKWFGVLVPQSLKTAQKRFQESLYLAARIGDIGSELNIITDNYHKVKGLKNKLFINNA